MYTNVCQLRNNILLLLLTIPSIAIASHHFLASNSSITILWTSGWEMKLPAMKIWCVFVTCMLVRAVEAKCWHIVYKSVLVTSSRLKFAARKGHFAISSKNVHYFTDIIVRNLIRRLTNSSYLLPNNQIRRYYRVCWPTEPVAFPFGPSFFKPYVCKIKPTY